MTHEYRHAVQYGNLHRRFMKWVGYVVGQQAGLLSSVLLPIWFLEGDAVMNETQMASFGRALQPSFTIEYRAYLTEGTKKFPLDKWFCGSYKNYIPDHYQFGYQLAAWSREQYGDDMWSRVAEYGSKYPYTILTTKWALHKYYRTSVNEIARNTWMGGDREAGEDLWTVLAEDCRRYLGDRDEFTARIRTILLMLATLRGDEEKAMSIARKLQADHPDDWDECDMTEAVALLVEAGITPEDFQ